MVRPLAAALLSLALAACATRGALRPVDPPAPASDAPGAGTHPRLTRAPIDPAEARLACPRPAPPEPGVSACHAAGGACPPSARLRPSDGWTAIEAARTAPLRGEREARAREWCEQRARTKSLLGAGAAIAGTLAYGLTFWQYGDGDFGFANERWFEEDTSHGGADKAGHFTAAHIWTAGVSAIHREWGFSRKEAALRGASISFLALTMIEVADGTSARYGFSFSDLAADAAGCVVGYLHEVWPWAHETFDLRWEYFPHERSTIELDPTSDYEASSYVLAANVGALRSRIPSAWDLLQVGYRTRGYSFADLEDERWLFVGVGLNVANLLRRVGFRGAAFFDYFQLPFVSLRVGHEVNDGETALLYGP